MSVLKLIKKTQISLITTILLISLVVVLTLLVNAKLKNLSTSPEHAGGSATGNAIKLGLQTPQDSKAGIKDSTSLSTKIATNSTENSKEPYTAVTHTIKDTAYNFEHLFEEDSVPQKYHYQSKPDSLDFHITQDTLSALELREIIDSLRLHKSSRGDFSELTIGTELPYHTLITGSLILEGVSNLTLYGLKWKQTGNAITLKGCDNITLWGTEINSDSSSAIRSSRSYGLLLRELNINHSQIAIELNDTDHSAYQDPFIRIERSLLHNNQTAISVKNSYGILLKDNFLGYNTKGLELHPQSTLSMNTPGSVELRRNVFYQSPAPLSSEKHFVRSNFLKDNLFDDSQEKSQLESLAWFWLAH